MDLRREKKRAIMRYAGYVAGTLGVGGLSALLSRGGMEAFAHLKKPSFSLFLCLGTPSDRLFLASSAARARRGYGVPVRKYPSRSRKIEHSVSPVAVFRRRVEYIGIHFKQVKRFRMARNWFAGQFFVKTCFS